MKIDLHTHTKKCKSGDAPTREISPAELCEKILSTDVGIFAITNHNLFDLVQYEEIQTGLGDIAQVWPGIELDVIDSGSRGHLLVIVSPRLAREFSTKIDNLTHSSSPDLFTTTIEKILENFDPLNSIYVAHYKQKKPSISEDALAKLETGTKNPKWVIKEVTNAISAGIYISHGHSSIYGSDVQDWGEYEERSRGLPDLRLPVDSFEHFCLLLNKDTTTINTALDKKTSEELTLRPFGDDSIFKLKVFNDINVIFGPKGTGKTCILRAIAKHYSDSGIEAKVYESTSDRLNKLYDMSGNNLNINLNPYGINYCTDEIKDLRNAREESVTSLSKYVAFFNAKRTNINAKKILLKDIEPEEESSAQQDFFEFNQAVGTTANFLDFLANSTAVKKELKEEELSEVVRILSTLQERLRNREWIGFSSWKESCLLNSAIEGFSREIERKTGSPAKPVGTGFRTYATNRIKIEANAAKIVKSINTEIPTKTESVGSLGSIKGNLECKTEFKFHDGNIRNSAFTPIAKSKKVKKTMQEAFAQHVRDILAHAYDDDLFQHISALDGIEGVEHIETVYELLMFHKYFALDGQLYAPSSGEASMVMLQKELESDKEVYILDEPERSLGNDYINDVIVPLIKERARAGRKMFISTHDANIAVRTLPYCSIYRCHHKTGYKTYIGNPFSNNLVNPDNVSEQLDWKKISMRTLEGGEEAFGERGRIYGNS